MYIFLLDVCLLQKVRHPVFNYVRIYVLVEDLISATKVFAIKI
ncbi:hypothetical protein JOD43_002960 [Pullulanibacillus pueri]|nr:hypothetical protein [Pullulanibacillus pueri]